MLAAGAVTSGGCATYQDHMKAGRYFEACNMRFDDPKNADDFDQWARGAAETQVTLVAQQDVEGWLGGPVARYGQDVGVYRVVPTLKGAQVALTVGDLGLDPALLVALLPPLVALKEPLVPPGPYADADFKPDAPPEEDVQRNSHHHPGLVEGLVGAFFGVGKAIGAAVGAAVGIPLALTVGMVVGGVEMVGGLAGASHPYYGANGGVRTLGTVSKVDPAPIFLLTPGKATHTWDALLNAQDHRRFVEEKTAELAVQRAAVEKEQARRLELAARPPEGLLGCNARQTDCRLVLRPGEIRPWLYATFEKDGGQCSPMQFTQTVTVPALDGGRPLWPPPKAPMPITVEDEQAPSWVHVLPVSTNVPPAAATAATRLDHAHCAVKLNKKALGHKTPPSLSVRVTAGRDYPRVRRWALGPVKDGAVFLAAGLHLEPGERLRLGFSDATTGRGLGGGVTEFTGALPLTMHNEVLSVTCHAADGAALAAAQHDASSTFAAHMDGLKQALAAQQAEAMVKHRDGARAALLSLVHHTGWSDPAVTAAWQRLAAEDPAEKHSPHPVVQP